MSFLSVLKSIGHVFEKVAGINNQFATIIETIPGGAAFEAIFSAVFSVEQMIANMLGANAQSNPALSASKKAIATLILAAHPATASLPPEVVSSGIDQVVANMNAMQATQAHIAGAAAA